MKPLVINILSISSADVGTRLIGFLAFTYLARILGPENMGIIAIGMAILTYASIISTMGLPALGVRSASVNKSSARNLVKRICSTRFFLSIISFLVIMGFLMIWVKEQNIRNVSIFYLFSLFPSALMIEWLFKGRSKMITLAIGQILGMSVYLLIIIGVVSNSQDIYWVPFAWFLGLFVQTIYFWINYKYFFRNENYENQPLHLYKIIKQGLPLGISGLISHSVIQFPVIYLGFFDSTEKAGIYSVAFRVIIMMLVIDRVFSTIFFPLISRSYKDSIAKLNERVIWTLKIVTAGSLYIAVLALITGRNLLPIIFGSEFRNSGLIFQILLGFFVLTTINSVFTFTLIGIEKEHLYTKSLFIGAMVFSAIIFSPLPLPATLIVSIALAAHEAVSMLMMMKYLRQFNLTNLFYRVFLALLVTIIFVIIVVLWQHLYPILVPVGVAILALPAIAIASGINNDDINTFKGLLK